MGYSSNQLDMCFCPKNCGYPNKNGTLNEKMMTKAGRPAFVKKWLFCSKSFGKSILHAQSSSYIMLYIYIYDTNSGIKRNYLKRSSSFDLDMSKYIKHISVFDEIKVSLPSKPSI